METERNRSGNISLSDLRGPARSLGAFTVHDSNYSYIRKFARTFGAYTIGIFLGWIYLIIPNVNNWVYNLVRKQFFAILVVIGYTEIVYLCVPDAAEATYVMSYLLGIVLPPICRVVVWFCYLQNNFVLGALIPAVPCFVVWILYLIDALQYRNSENISLDTDPLLYDTFAIVDDDCSENPSDSLSFSVSSWADSTIASNPLTTRLTASENIVVQKVNMSTTAEMYRRTRKLIDSKQVRKSQILQFNASRFWFLPRFLCSKPNLRAETQNCDRIWPWLFSALFILFFVICWLFVLYFTKYFRKHTKSSSSLVYLFLIFIVINTVLRVCVKRIGMTSDRYKIHTTSAFFIGEVLCLLFYYTFYRVLFQSVTSWFIFLSLQFLHLSLEWLCYPFRASKVFHNGCEYIRKHCDWRGNILMDFFYSKDVSFDDWRRFLALDFGIRVTVVIASGLGISLYLISLSYIPWVSNDLEQDHDNLWLTVRWIAIAVALELMNAFAMNFFFFSRNGVSVRDMVVHAFNDDRFCFVTTVIVAINFLNPVFAFSTGNVYNH
jgi:hypothetical protein